MKKRTSMTPKYLIRRTTLLWIVCASCATLAQPSYTLPDPLELLDGGPVTDSATWYDIRRGELLALFGEHVYGFSPGRPESVAFDVFDVTEGMMDGTATRKQVSIDIDGPYGSKSVGILIFVPSNRQGPAPLFLLLNHLNRGVMDPERSVIEDFWPAEEVIARGYAVAAIYIQELAPDDPAAFKNGVINLFDPPGERPPDVWATIAAWAWGGIRAMDYFETDDDIDNSRIAVVGHSRGGKAALWCGAQDQRFAMTVSNMSGCTGAALSRRRIGETVAAINNSFPHWFCDNYKSYNDNEDALPIDQHECIALIAPRLVYVSSAEEDGWADPQGEFESCVQAEPAYHLLGVPGIETNQMPPVDQPVVDGRIGYHIRSGGHDLTSYDWQRFMDFADLHMGEVSGIFEEHHSAVRCPYSFYLQSPHPNPASGFTVVSFTLRKRQWVRLGIYDLKGRLVAELYRGLTLPGSYHFRWDGIDRSGNSISPGHYLQMLDNGEHRQAERLTVAY